MSELDTTKEKRLSKHEQVLVRPNYVLRTVDVTRQPNFEPYRENFKDNPVVEMLDNGKDFTLRENMDFYFWLYQTPDGYLQCLLTRQEVFDVPFGTRCFYVHITIKEGFTTDFVSSPQFLWWLVSPIGRAAKPSVLHDLFYRHNVVMDLLACAKQEQDNYEASFQKPISQRHADEIFYLSLLLRDIPQWRSWLMYKGLRLFGRFNFHKSLKD